MKTAEDAEDAESPKFRLWVGGFPFSLFPFPFALSPSGRVARIHTGRTYNLFTPPEIEGTSSA